MPRTSTIVLPGCAPLRAFTADELGFVKVVESREAQGQPQVVTRWGEADRKHAVQALSFLAEGHGTLAIARKDCRVDILDALTGQLQSSFKVEPDVSSGSVNEEPRSLCGVELLQGNSSRRHSVVTCTSGGSVSMRAMPGGTPGGEDDGATAVVEEWKVLSGGHGTIGCLRADASGAVCAVGGKGHDVGVWDLEKRSKTFAAKSSKPNSLNIVTPPWVTSLAFLCSDDPRKVAAGSGHHQVLLYDTAAQRRPVMKVEFGEAPVKAVAADTNGLSFYAGNGVGAIARFDMRMGGRMVGSFKGASAGSIRSIARHPDLPLLASCGLDRYLRIHDTNTRQLLAKVYLKQQLAAVEFDTREDAVPPPPAVEKGGADVRANKGVEAVNNNVAEDAVCGDDKLKEEDVIETFKTEDAEGVRAVGTNKRKKRVQAKGQANKKEDGRGKKEKREPTVAT